MSEELLRVKKMMKLALEPGGEPSFADRISLGQVDWDFLFGINTTSPLTGNLNEYNFFLTFKRLQEYLKLKVDPAEIERNAKIPPEVIEYLSAAVLGAKIPGEYDGLELTTPQYCELMKLISSCHPALGIWFTANCSIGLSGYLMVVHNELIKELEGIKTRFNNAVPDSLELIKIAGELDRIKKVILRTKWQMGMFLPKLARGANAGFGLTQITAGSDPAAMIGTDTIAEKIEGGKIHLKGHKLYNTNATIAECEVVMAPLAPGNKICAFIVPAHGYGKFEVTQCDFAGNRGIENGFMVFDVIIPADFIIGREGEGLKNALNTLNVGRLAMAAGSLATEIQCLQIARWWSKVRVQMGLPIGKYKQIAIRVAQIACNVFATEAMMKIGSNAYDDFRSKHDMRLMTAAIKLWSTEAAYDAALNLADIRSGHGYETYESQLRRSKLGIPNEVPLPDDRFIDDARVLLIGEGTSDIQKLIIFGVMASPHISKLMPFVDSSLSRPERLFSLCKASSYVPWILARIFGWIFSLNAPKALVSNQLRKRIDYINRQSNKLALKVLWNTARFGLGLMKENLITGFMAKQLVELWAMATVCRYATELYKDEGEIVIEIADVFCGYAKQRMAGFAKDVPEPETDQKAYQLAQKIIFPKDGEDAPVDFLESGIISILEREIARHGTKNSYM